MLAERILQRRQKALSRVVGLDLLAKLLKEDSNSVLYVSKTFNEAFLLAEGHSKCHHLADVASVDSNLQSILKQSFNSVLK